jgi:hypothetical protein
MQTIISRLRTIEKKQWTLKVEKEVRTIKDLKHIIL